MSVWCVHVEDRSKRFCPGLVVIERVIQQVYVRSMTNDEALEWTTWHERECVDKSRSGIVQSHMRRWIEDIATLFDNRHQFNQVFMHILWLE